MHHQVVDLLSAYHDGELPAVQQAKVEAHLQTCASCRGHLAQLQALSDLLTTYQVEIERAEEFWERLESHLLTQERTASPVLVRGQKARRWAFIPPLILLGFKVAVQAVLFISVAFWGACTLGLLPIWVEYSTLSITALVPDLLAESVVSTLFSRVLPNPLFSLMRYAVGQPPAIISELSGFLAPALLYTGLLVGIACVYLTWMALWWQDWHSSSVGNGG
ncbi:MAG: zf-HC2 domain-containing protein [Anaerolineae bacterium]|jgi:predicted anti-sigma-YlaC factor YlaD|nr:zf-HC2 domain-containing protein [Anaerolineae bacterium]MDH7474839.1 zf-HC2 domain-containing protein [Anaerolineae bacterium]